MNKYPITFYNAIWLILFTLLCLDFSWWLFVPVFLFCPSWLHVREWHDGYKRSKPERYV
jgi:hypothetical protein